MERALAEPGQPMPLINFVPRVQSCPVCAEPLGIYKTWRRVVTTLAEGRFEARVVQLRCDRGSPVRKDCPTVTSDEFARLVPVGQSFGFDLIVYVGLARYQNRMQRIEIQAALKELRIELSTGSITALCDRFLIHLERLHLLRAPYLRAAMSGGWALHLDATCDKGKGGLFLCMDGIRGWVLLSEKIGAESGQILAPVVQRTVEVFGDPVATVRDLGGGMEAAVAPLRERGIPDLVCHQHFLKAVGTKLMEKAYDRLRALLKGIGLQSALVELRRELRPFVVVGAPEAQAARDCVRKELPALVHWLIQGEGKKELPFPFALHHLDRFLRCRAFPELVKQWLPRPWSAAEHKIVHRLDSLVRKLHKDPRFGSTVLELQQRWGVFCELRGVMRLADSEIPGTGSSPRQLPFGALELLRLAEIKATVEQYEQELRRRAGADAKKKRPTRPDAIVLQYLEDYRGRLFGHPALRDQDGLITAVVQRTNAPPEHFFGRSKQQLRRRLGHANVGRDLQQQPAQAALVPNLEHADYVRVLCGSIEHLAEAFAGLDRGELVSAKLVRDHRDSRLDRLVRQLLAQAPPPVAACLPQPAHRSNAHATRS